jgi:hypothetical protein
MRIKIDIDTTDGEPEKEKKEETKTPDEILDLIQLVDRNVDSKGKPLFRGRDIFGGSFGWSVSIIGILFGFEILFGILRSFGLISLVDLAALEAAFLAILIGFLSMVIQLVENSQVEVRFEKALKLRASFTDNQKLILKALIKIRSKLR